MSPKDQTQVPPKGQEQEDQPPSTTPEDAAKKAADLESRLAALQKDFDEQKTKLSESEKQLKAKDVEARKLQAAADQRARLITRVQQNNPPPGAPPGRVPTQPGAAAAAQQERQELVEFANQQAKDAVLYRELLNRGMKLEDVEGIEFESRRELVTQLNLIQQQNEIAALRKQLEAKSPPEGSGEEGTPPAPPPSTPKVDTGGRSVNEAQEQLTQLRDIRQKAGELKGQKRFQEATYLALRAARRDPEKASIVKSPSEEE